MTREEIDEIRIELRIITAVDRTKNWEKVVSSFRDTSIDRMMQLIERLDSYEKHIKGLVDVIHKHTVVGGWND